MVRRIKRERFEKWWEAKKVEWDETRSCLNSPFSIFRTDERAARVYLRAVRRRERSRPSDYTWHATYLHRTYGRRRGHR